MDRERNYQKVLKARRMLDELDEDCQVQKDVVLINGEWVILLNLRNKGKVTSDFPEWTSWYVMLGMNYPEDDITFYPLKKGGISAVYPHQSPHQLFEESLPFFASNPCLEQYHPGLISQKYDIDKLYQYVVQSLEWIKRASQGDLLAEGDHFELVAYPSSTDTKVIFSEDKLSFTRWKNSEEKVGFCNIKSGSISKNQHRKIFYITDFYFGKNSYKKENKQIKLVKWGNYVVSEKTQEQRGIWLKLKEMPRLEPWEAPKNWGELISILKESKIDFKKDIFPILDEMRDGLTHYMVLGFPIPKIVGSPNIEYFWQALTLPVLSNVRTPAKQFKGFRKNELGYRTVDKKFLFSKNKKITWVKSENWSPSSLISRGGVTEEINQLNYLVIGVGSLGSAITELMVRAGVTKLDIIDPDILKMGNLVRHKLLASDINYTKASKMQERLSNSNIHYTGKSFTENIEDYLRKNPKALSKYDVIIETTGDDKVLNSISSIDSNVKMFSISIGLDAKHLYVYSENNRNIDMEMFVTKINPFLKMDSTDFQPNLHPRDGIGCWHPLFPARIDHVEILAGIAVNIIEEDISCNKNFITVVERGQLGSTAIVVRDEML